MYHTSFPLSGVPCLKCTLSRVYLISDVPYLGCTLSRIYIVIYLAADVGKTESGLLQPPGTVEAEPSSNKGQPLPVGMKEMFPFRQGPTTQHRASQGDPVDIDDGNNNSTPPGHTEPTAVTATMETEGSRREGEPSAEIPPNQPGRKGEGKGDPTASEPQSRSEDTLQLRKHEEGSNDDDPKRTSHGKLPPVEGEAQHGSTEIADNTKRDKGEPKGDGHDEVSPGSTAAAVTAGAGSKAENISPTVAHAGEGVGEEVKRAGSSHQHGGPHTKVNKPCILFAVPRTYSRNTGQLKACYNTGWQLFWPEYL